MIRLIKRKLSVIVEADTQIKKRVRKLLQKKMSITNPDYPFIQRNYYYTKNRLAKLQQENQNNPSQDLKQQISELTIKIRNIQRYLDNTSPDICFYKVNKDTDIDLFGIGFLGYVKKLLKKRNFAYTVIDPLKKQYPKISLNKKEFNRQYQYEAVEKLLKRKFGIVKLPTGSGKTVLSLKAIQALLPHLPNDKKILFIVEQKDLIVQTKEEYIDKEPKLNGTISTIGDGIFDITGKIIIATVQSLTSFKKRRTKLFNEFKHNIFFYIVDECDMFTSDKRLKFLRSFDEAMYRLFLSATPVSRFKQVRRWKLKELAGNIIYTVTEEQLIEQKYLAKQDAVFIKNYNLDNKNVRHIFWKDRWKYTYENMIVNSKYRNSLAKQIALIAKTYRLRCLFVTERKEHALLLGEMLDVPVYTGDNDTLDRRQAVKDIESGLEKIIVTTRIFRRAINIPKLELFVNMAGYKNDSMTTQSKGRIGRITKEKDRSLYIDFFDFGNQYLEEHSMERMKTMKELGIDSKTLYINELEDFVVEYFQIKK